MAFLKFNNSKNIVAVNRKRLKSLTYHGKTYQFDIDKGNDVQLTIENPLCDCDVHCYKIANNIIYDFVKCPEEVFLQYVTMIKGLGVPEIPLNNNDTANFCLVASGILSLYTNFGKSGNAREFIMNSMQTLNKLTKGQNELYLMARTYEDETGGTGEEKIPACAFMFYNLASKKQYDTIKAQYSTQEAWDEFNNALAQAGLKKVTDYNSYLEVLDGIENKIVNGFKDGSLTTENATTLLSFVGFNETSFSLACQMAVKEKHPDISSGDDSAFAQYIPDSADLIFDYVYSTVGLSFVELSEADKAFEKIEKEDQSSDIVVSELMNSNNLIDATYYYNKKFEKITSFVTRHISENLISSDIFFPQALGEDNNVNIKQLKVDISNLFQTPIDDSKYSYVSQYPILKIAYIKDTTGNQAHNYLYGCKDYNKMSTLVTLDIPENCNKISIILVTNDKPIDYWIEDLGVTMFAENDTTHTLPEGTQVKDWAGYRTYKLHDEYESRPVCKFDGVYEGYIDTSRNYKFAYQKYDVNQTPSVSATCLAGDTLITMADLSHKQLKDIHVGDKVLTKVNGKLESSEVVYCDSNLTKTGMATRYTFRSEFEERHVDVIHDHRFFNGKKCKHISRFQLGEKVMDRNGNTFTLTDASPMMEMRHFTLFTKNCECYFANDLEAGNIFCNINPRFLARFLQKCYLFFVRIAERKHK